MFCRGRKRFVALCVRDSGSHVGSRLRKRQIYTCASCLRVWRANSTADTSWIGDWSENWIIPENGILVMFGVCGTSCVMSHYHLFPMVEWLVMVFVDP